ncbi:MAG TPA: methylmalonyl Co-A mutase-associated GTPase MeaB [Bacteroidales bacterium]|nr:methylmalonyl Co-A mutase-associated GTPase MeaB [Bacteroidales bacterium]
MTEKDKKDTSALNVNGGSTSPGQVNQVAVQKYRKIKKKQLSAGEYFEGIRSGNRTVLSKAITLIESSLPAHQDKAQEIITRCLPWMGNSIRLGITGVPGVGKSTFIESFGKYLTSRNHKVAVLAIDPSSERSRGSILGDKTRMEALSSDPMAFIRPSPSGGSLGGVARKTRETIILCEAAGFDTVVIETVGVGQSETVVHSMVDFFLLLMLAGAGDELQGIKRGIMEMADGIAINKADGSNMDKARLAKMEYENALHLFPLPPSGWTPKVLTCSAKANIGIADIWSMVCDYKSLTLANGYFNGKRKEQLKYRMYETIQEQLNQHFFENPEVKSEAVRLEKEVLENRITAYSAAGKLLKKYSRQLRKE